MKRIAAVTVCVFLALLSNFALAQSLADSHASVGASTTVLPNRAQSTSSGANIQLVRPAAGVHTQAGSTPSQTVLTASPNPAAVGAVVTLTATVTPSGATGSVTFLNNTTVLGTSSLSGGVAVFTTTTLPLGTDSLTAQYSGDSTYAASTSPAISEVIAPVTETLLSVSPAAAVLGQVVTLTATVTGSPTGTVTFYDGVRVLGVVPVVSNTATLTTVLLAVGANPITARYDGDANNAPSTSLEMTVTVTATAGGGFNLSSFATGSKPVAIVDGDLNNDGHPDLVTVNQGANTVSVFLGQANGTYLQAAGSPLAVGASPSFAAIGDFNGDGKPDLVVANEGDNTLSVFLGNGDGTFQTPTLVTGVPQPSSLATGDFDGNGTVDLAVANLSTSAVSILLGNGTGGFGAPVSITLPGAPQNLIVSDFNGDGKADIAVVNSVAGSVNDVSILLGGGGGTFTLLPPITVGLLPVWVTAGDFNGDGKTDLAVANSGNPTSTSISILLGNNDGTFQAPVAISGGAGAVAVRASDYNGDGNLDLAVVSNAGSTVKILFGAGDGTFQPPVAHTVGAGPLALVTADLNGDGRADIAVTDGTGTVDILLADLASSVALTASPNPALPGATVTLTATVSPSAATGSVTFFDGATNLGSVPLTAGVAVLTTTSLPVGANSITAQYTGDSVYGSSTSPVVVENIQQPSTVTLAVSPAASSFGQAVTLTATVTPSAGTGSVTFYDGATVLGAAPVSGGVATFTTILLPAGTNVLTARYDGDANDTSSISAPVTATVTTQAGNGFAAPVTYATPSAAYAVVMGDFNKDGFADVASADLNTSQVSVLLGTSTGVFQPAVNYAVGTTPVAIAMGDFNGDGLPDIITSNTTGGSVSVLLGTGGGAFAPVINSPAGPSAIAIAVGDFNQDGFPDVAVTNSNSNQISILIGNGNGTFQAPVAITVGGGPVAIAVGDFNHDNIPDLAVSVGGGVAILLGNGGGTFRPAVMYTAGTGTAGIAVADFNGDGNPDLVVVNSLSDSVSVLLGNPDGTFQAAASYAAGTFPQGVAVGDFNGDGKLDIAVADESGNTVTLLYGNGNGTFLIGSSYAAGNSPLSLAVGPFTTNGKADLAVGDLLSNSIAILFAQAPDSVTLTAVPNPDAPGQPVVLTATVSPNVATGTVNFLDGTTVIGSAPLVNGVATLTYANFAAGTHNLTAQYLGDATYGSAVSPVVVEVVNKAASTVTLAVSPVPGLLGQNVTLTATVNFTTATGSVTFYNGGLILGSVPVANGVATLVTNQLPAGMLPLEARYDGDASYFGSVSPVVSETVTAQVSFSFAPAVNYSAITAPKTMAYGDLNKDGITDLVVSNSTGIAVLLGNGTGGFKPPLSTAYPAGSAPVSIALADVNGDGNVDVVTANTGTNNITILLGNGAGGFTTTVTTYPDAYIPGSIAIGDFNGDGKPDLVVANTTGGNVNILFGNGDGTFAAGSSPFAGVNNVYAAIGDFNGDGLSDIAVADLSAGQVWILIAKADGSFQSAVPYSAGSGALAISVGDVNNDGKLDLVVADQTGSAVTILLGVGDGTFTTFGTYPAGGAAQFVALGDFNGDGKLDAAVAILNGPVNILLGNGDGSLQPAISFPVGTNPVALAVGSFNGDGKTQIAVANQGSNNISVLLDTSGPISIVQGSPQSTAVGTSFPAALEVEALAFGAPAAGVSVTFSAPVSGPTGLFAGSGSTATVLTGANGIAVAPAFTANGVPGAYQVTATAASASVAFSLTNTGVGCTYGISAPNFAFDSTGGFGAITVIPSSPSCAWSATVDSSWISLTNANGVGTGTVNFSVASNSTGVARNGTILIGGQFVPVSEAATAQIFIDVPPSAYYFDAVNLLYQQGVTAGCGPQLFCPTTNVTRAETAIFIVRAMLGTDNFTYSPTPYFADVTPTSFGFQWIQKLYELGITAGCGNNNFCPDSDITRDEMSIFIIRGRYGATTVFDYPPTPYFTDVPANYFAFPWIQRLKEDGITAGCGPTTFCPLNTVTRGDMAIFVERGLFNLLLPVGDPLLTSVTPTIVAPGTTATLTVTGVNTSFVGGQTVFSPVANVTFGAVTVISPTSLTVPVTISGTAPTDVPFSLVAITGAQEAVLPHGVLIQ